MLRCLPMRCCPLKVHDDSKQKFLRKTSMCREPAEAAAQQAAPAAHPAGQGAGQRRCRCAGSCSPGGQPPHGGVWAQLPAPV